MQLDKYALKAESSLTVFEFISEGPNGLIYKLIQFQDTNQPNVYNLAFGDKNSETGELDDLAVSNNGDTDKVLATVVAALYAFFEQNTPTLLFTPPGARAHEQDFIELVSVGSTTEMIEDFELYGQAGNEFHAFEVGKKYSGFFSAT